MTSVTQLDNFGFLAVSGEDALSFLQGYVTCDVNSLDTAHACLGAMCNLQGRMVNSFRMALVDDGVLLRMDRSLVASTREFLKKYIVFSRAETRDDSDRWKCFGVVGEGRATLPGSVNDLVVCEDHCIVRVSDQGPRFEVWARGPLAMFDEMARITPNEWRRREIREGLAWVSEATADAFIPQMLNYDRLDGISFDKGCYLGQEIVARMQHRGEAKRRLYRGEVASPAAAGNAVTNSAGKNIGTIVSAAGADHGCEVLAVIQTREADDSPRLEDGGELTLTPAFDA